MWTGKVTEVVQKHIWCVIIGLVAISVGILTVRFGSSDEAVNLLGFATAVASIILAIVAIAASAFSSWRSEQNARDLQLSLGRSQRKLEKKVWEGLSKIDPMLETMAKTLTPPSEAKSKKLAQPLQGDYRLNLNSCPFFTLMAIYTIAMAHKFERPWNPSDITSLILSHYKKISAPNWFAFLSGSSSAFGCFLEPNSICRATEGKKYDAKVINLPSDLLDYAKKQLEGRIAGKGPLVFGEALEDLVAIKSRIDNYFETGKMPEDEAEGG